MAAKNISFSVKLLGWKQLENNARSGAHAIDQLGNSAQRSGREAAESARGWGVFEKQADRSGRAAASAERQTARTSRGFAGLRTSSLGGIAAFAAVRSGALAGAVGVGLLGAAAAKSGLAFDAFAETQQTAFATLLHSQSKAARFMEDLKKSAAATPFELKDLTTASQRLLAFGFSVKQTKGLLTDLGDASSSLGTGAEGFQQLSLVFGQIKAKGRLQGDEVLQLAENGVPALQILQKQLGLTKDQLQKKLSAGAIDSTTAINGLRKGMQQLYGGGMRRQSATFSGQLSTLKDNFDQLLGKGAAPLFSFLRDKGIPAINGLFNGFQKGTGTGGRIARTFRTIGRTVSRDVWPPLRRFGQAIGVIASEQGPKVIAFARSLYRTFSQAVGPIRPIGTAFLLVGRRIGQLARIVGRALWPIIRRMLPGIGQAFKGVAQVIGGTIRTIVALIHGDWAGAWKGMKTIAKGALNALVGQLRIVTAPFREAASRMFGGLKDGFKAAINWIIGAWNGLKFTIGGTDLGPFGKLPKTTLNTPDIPKLAKGGVARRAGMALVGERGPELLRLPRGARVDPLPCDGAGPRLAAHIVTQLVLPNGRLLAESTSQEILRATRYRPAAA